MSAEDCPSILKQVLSTSIVFISTGIERVTKAKKHKQTQASSAEAYRISKDIFILSTLFN